MNRSRLASAIPGSGHRGKTASSWTAIRATSSTHVGAGAAGEVGEVARSTLGIANAQPGQPALDDLGDIVVCQEPGVSHKAED